MAHCLLVEFAFGPCVMLSLISSFVCLSVLPYLWLRLLQSLLSLPFYIPPLASLLLLNEPPACPFTENDEERSSPPHPQCPEGFLRKWADQVVHI